VRGGFMIYGEHLNQKVLSIGFFILLARYETAFFGTIQKGYAVAG
jgi:hypothetical protein